MKEQQLLRDPNIEPTSEVIAAGLGSANTAYIKFIEELPNHEIELGWRYYTDGNAWLAKGQYKWTGPRGGQKETTAFWLSIWDGFFKVTVFVPEKARADVLNLPLDGETKRTVENAKQMGKLKIFPLVFDVRSDEIFDDIYALVNFRKLIK